MKNKNHQEDLESSIEKVSVHDHLCLIYKNKEEQFASAVPFMRIGLERGEKCIYIADDNTAKEVVDAMSLGKIDVEAELKKGSLTIINKKDSYLRNGSFDPDEMIQFLAESSNQAKKEGYTALRVTGEMTWILGSEQGPEPLIEYEAKLNQFFPKNDCLALCQYNYNRFSPAILLDVIRTHPIVIVGSVVCKNFYYVPVEEFLKAGKETLEEVDRLLNNLIDRQQIEEELIESGEKYQRIIETANEGIFIMDQNHNITFANPRMLDIFGYKEKEILGHKLNDFIVSEKIADHEKTNSYERRFNSKNNGIIWVHISTTPLFDEKKQFVGAFGMLTDITNSKKAELEREQFFKFFNLSTDIMVIADPNGAFRKVNTACLNLLGYSEDELISKPFIDFVHPDDRQSTLDEMARQIKTGFSLSFENRYICKDNSIVWLSWHASYIKNEKTTYATARDISTEKYEEKDLARLNTAMMVVSEINQALIRVNDESTLLKEACRIATEIGDYPLAWIGFVEQDKKKSIRPVANSGLNSDKYVVKEKLSWSDEDRSHGPGEMAIRTGETSVLHDIATYQTKAPWKERALKAGYKSIAALPLLSGAKPFGLFMIYSSETDAFPDKEIEVLNELAGDLAFGINNLRERAEKEKVDQHVKELSEVRSKFISIISHQLRTPLTVVNWNLETILNGDFGKMEETQRKFLQATHSSSSEIIRRINFLLTAMDIEEQRIIYENEEVNIGDLCVSVVNEMSKNAELRNINYEYIAPSKTIASTHGDGKKIRMLFSILIENAIAYTKDNGKITMTLQNKGDVARFEITDTGIGIPRGEQHRVFTRFFRASNASVMQVDAFGLGLFVAKNFVEQCGGKIGFQSEEGKGSTFWLELPLK